MTNWGLRLVLGHLILTSFLWGVLPRPADADDSDLSVNEAEFHPLFNGKDLNDWSNNGNWEVQNGVIARIGDGGDLVYQQTPVPDDFELQFEWKVAKGSNSGVYYRPGQYEYQILDNQIHKDGKNPRTSAASLYFCMQPSHDATRPVGQWNRGRIICKGTVIQHWLNGEKVVGFDYSDPKWSSHVELLSQRGGELAARGAYLRLQDHGDPVWYRNIRIRSVDPDEVLDRSLIAPAEISQEILEAEKKKLEGIVAARKSREQKKEQQPEARAATPVEAIK